MIALNFEVNKDDVFIGKALDDVFDFSAEYDEQIRSLIYDVWNTSTGEEYSGWKKCSNWDNLAHQEKADFIADLIEDFKR